MVSGAEVVLLVVALGVVAELALEDAAPRRFQQQHSLVGGVEDAGKVGRAELVQVRQRRTEGRPAPRSKRDLRTGGRNIQARNGERRHLVVEKGEQ